jgi:CHAT domain-containing protein
MVGLILLTLMSFIVVLNLPAWPIDARQLLQAGVERYEAEQFAAAAEVWTQALAGFEAQDDALGQALVQSNLASAYQHLGRWEDAEAAIATSFNLLQTPGTAEPSPTALNILAKAHNTQGRLHLSRGRPDAALNAWQQATLAYSQANDTRGVVLSSMNQAEALQALGLSVQAEAILEQVYQVLQTQPLEPSLQVTGLWHLGNAQRRLGDLNASLTLLQESLAMAEQAGLTSLTSSILLDLGNTERALSHRAIAIGNREDAQARQAAAIAAYQQAARTATLPIRHVQAGLNHLSLLTETGQISDAAGLWSTIEPKLFELPSGRSALFAYLNAARSLICLRQQVTQTQSSCLREDIQPELGQSSDMALPSWIDIAQLLTTVIQQARTLPDPRAEAYATGQLGELYELTGQWTDAQRLTQQALLQTEAIQAPDIRYRWAWQLGRLREKQGDQEAAIAAYKDAVEALKSVRHDLLRISSDVQFSFRDDVEPVYRELVKLLLSTEGGTKPSLENLKDAIQQVDELQLSELENFLGCDLAQTADASEFEADLTTAKIYPILLDDRLAVILELPNSDQTLEYSVVFKSHQDVEAILKQLRENLREPDRTPEAIAGLQEVYQWLIAPFEPVLENNRQIETLVFALDGELRNIPMAALHDGEQYLITRYAVAVTPRLELFKPSPRSRQLNVFLGGVGDPQTVSNRAFSEIENLIPELSGIQQLVDANPPLLNEEFTETNLKLQLSKGRFSVIHLKTHGVFSSNPEETFIVAYQELITSQKLGSLIQTGRIGAASSVELLVLSACSTAKGDDRAVLGLAGTAVQAGAHSAISTLWEAQDLPNTQLMIQFYQELLNPDTTRAKALRLAQLHLLEQGYRTPHVWATYVLVGNWL